MIILEYDKTTNQCIAVIGDTTNLDEYPLQDGINYPRDSMAALKRMAWEEKGHYSRADLNFDQERQSFRQDIEDYPPPDWEYEQRIIFRPN